MTTPRNAPRRLVRGTTYAARPAASDGEKENTAIPSAQGGLAHLCTSPEELGLIGAELAKRLTLAAEEFLSELAAEQVRGSFRQGLGAMFESGPVE